MISRDTKEKLVKIFFYTYMGLGIAFIYTVIYMLLFLNILPLLVFKIMWLVPAGSGLIFLLAAGLLPTKIPSPNEEKTNEKRPTKYNNPKPDLFLYHTLKVWYRNIMCHRPFKKRMIRELDVSE